MRIRVTGGQGPRDTKVYVEFPGHGEIEISKWLTGLTFRAGVDDLNSATLEIMPRGIEIDAEVAGEIVAQMIESGVLAIPTLEGHTEYDGVWPETGVSS